MNSLTITHDSAIEHNADKSHASQFVYALAHEIRNPLTNINLAVEMLRSEIKEDYLKKFLDIILLSSVQINDMINEYLKCQHADESHAENYSIQQLFDKVIEVAKERITLKNITLRKDYAEQDCTIEIMLNKTAQ